MHFPWQSLKRILVIYCLIQPLMANASSETGAKQREASALLLSRELLPHTPSECPIFNGTFEVGTAPNVQNFTLKTSKDLLGNAVYHRDHWRSFVVDGKPFFPFLGIKRLDLSICYKNILFTYAGYVGETFWNKQIAWAEFIDEDENLVTLRLLKDPKANEFEVWVDARAARVKP